MDDSDAGLSATDLLHRGIEHLHRESGKLSTREIARRTGRVVSHATVGEILRGERVPRWQSLEPIVRVLQGDVREFRRLWLRADDERGGVRGDIGQPRANGGVPTVSADGKEAGQSPSGVAFVDYFCYVSPSKVQRLYATMAASAGRLDSRYPGVEALFQSGDTFGRPHLLHGGSLDRIGLMRQLRRVLTELAGRGAITELDGAQPPRVSQYVHHAGIFRAQNNGASIRDPAVDVVRLECLSRPGLVLDCSLRYFSEAVDGRYALTSETRGFLSGGGELAFDTVFVLLNRTPEEIVGSPLYLKLYGGEVGEAL